MASLAQLVAWRDRLEDARYSGVRQVVDANGESIVYKSDNEMRSALAALRHEIAEIGGGVCRTIRFQTSKGI